MTLPEQAMTDQELRELVRGAIARRLAQGAGRMGDQAPSGPPHASHLLLPLAPGGEDGACIIEPLVRCNHCGYCLSFGH
jgi:hypothetical protein